MRVTNVLASKADVGKARCWPIGMGKGSLGELSGHPGCWMLLSALVVFHGFSAIGLEVERPVCTFDLRSVSRIESKGRVQDGFSENITRLLSIIVENEPQSIACLIDLLMSEDRYDTSVIPLWPEVFEGDVALVFLDNLFRDPTGKFSSFPELCWDNLLGRSGDERIPAPQLLRRYVERHGRGSIRERWREAWELHRDRIEWDEEARFFRVKGLDLRPCE